MKPHAILFSCLFLASVPANPLLTVARAADATSLFSPIESPLRLPSEMATLGNMHGDIAISKDGRVFVSVGGGPRPGIQVYSPAGDYLHNLPKYNHDFHGFVISEDEEGEYIIGVPSDGQSVIKMRLDGSEVLRLGADKFDGKLKRLTCVVVAPDGRIFAADGYGNDLIHVFDKQGTYVRSFGGREAPYRFKTCHKLVVDTRFDEPRLLCCDRENRRMVILTLEGEVLGEIADMKRPAAVTIHGDLAVVGEIEGRVSFLDKDGKRVNTLGQNDTPGEVATNQVAPAKWRPGVFTAPHGVALDQAGNLFVAEYNVHGRVLKFTAASESN